MGPPRRRSPEGIAEQDDDGAHVLGFVVAANHGSCLPAVGAAAPEGENSKELGEREPFESEASAGRGLALQNHPLTKQCRYGVCVCRGVPLIQSLLGRPRSSAGLPASGAVFTAQGAGPNSQMHKAPSSGVWERGNAWFPISPLDVTSGDRPPS